METPMQTSNLITQDPRRRPASRNEGYLALVWRRFKRNRLALVSLGFIALLLVLALFAPFFSPQDPAARNSNDIYLPPQGIHFFGDDGFSLRPFVHPFEISFDPETFEASYVKDSSQKIYLRFFAEGWDYRLFGLNFSTHLVAAEPGYAVYFLGTDGLGRDNFSRILHGMGVTLLMAGLITSICVVVGCLVGIASGYFGGRFDLWTQRLVELMLAFPELPLYLAVIAILPKTVSPQTTFVLFVLLLGSLKWAQLAREVRGKALVLREMDYVKSAIAVGASDGRIIVHHILPNVLSHVIVVATAMIPTFILTESFLSFLGVGIQPPMISLGLLLNAARDYQVLGSYPWLLSPVLFILVAVLAFNAAGDGLRDAVDPYSNR
ncbi:ABC transporter permease [Zobellella iuensis]|nr:ABC transporter permease [Zobellella iuensis]